MKLNLFSGLTATAAALFVTPAFANTKKTTNSAAAARPGTLVAMSGSGSLGSSSNAKGSYLGINLFPFSNISATVKAGNTSVDTPSTSFRTLPKQLEFYSAFGNWIVRPTLDLDLTIAANKVEENTSYMALGYMLNSNLEVGVAVSFERSTSEAADKSKTVSSEMLIGPHAVYYTEFGGLPIEADGRLFLISGSSETTTNNVTKTTVDNSGFGFEIGGKVTRELSSGLEYVGGVKLSYVKATDKADKNNEVTVTSTDFTIIPAGLRFKF